MKKTIFSLLATILVAGTSVVITGCNTVEGAGKDVQAGGAAIKDEAQEHKNY